MCPCLQVLGQIFMRSKMVTSILACMVCVYSSLKKKKNFKKSIVYLFIYFNNQFNSYNNGDGDLNYSFFF